MSIIVDDEVNVILDNKDGHTLPISSLIVGKLYHPFNNIFNKDEIKGILSQTKSSYDYRMASLMAFTISKSKTYESERFIYLWMAFNGMYGYFSKLIGLTQNFHMSREYREIIALQMLLGVGSETIKDKTEKSRIAYEIISIIRHYDNINITKDSLENGCDKELAKLIESKLIKSDSNEKYDMTGYGYLLTELAYYFRCKYIHANKPVSLFSYNDDIELKCLKIINNLLEEFIEDNLHKWFDEKYIKILLEKASKIDISLLKIR